MARIFVFVPAPPTAQKHFPDTLLGQRTVCDRRQRSSPAESIRRRTQSLSGNEDAIFKGFTSCGCINNGSRNLGFCRKSRLAADHPRNRMSRNALWLQRLSFRIDSKYNFIHQSASCKTGRRPPRHFDTRQRSLQRLQQRHEVPDRKHVVFHEDVQRLKRMQPLVQAVIDNRFAKWLERRTKLFEFRHAE